MPVLYTKPDGDKVKYSLTELFATDRRTIRRPTIKITAPANGESGAPALAVPSKKPSPKRSSPTTVTNTSGTETAPDWTAEQDAKLIELKTANKPWKEICSHIANKPIFEVKKRWGEIRPMSDAEKRKRDADKAKGDAKAAEGKANAAEGKGKGKGDGNQQDGKAKKRVSWANEITDSKEKKNGGTTTIQYSDDLCTFDEVIALNNIATKYDQSKWVAVASRFFDCTGKRLTPEQAKDRVERG